MSIVGGGLLRLFFRAAGDCRTGDRFYRRQQIKSTGEQGDGMALIGMILGGFQVVLVTCGVLFSIGLAITGLISNGFSGFAPGLK